MYDLVRAHYVACVEFSLERPLSMLYTVSPLIVHIACQAYDLIKKAPLDLEKRS